MDAALIVPPVLTSPCVVCEDEFEDSTMATVQCEHKFCRDCIQELFQRSQQDESLFPPKCCEAIAIEQVRDFLTPELLATHHEKKLEFETVDRTYCSDLHCHKFLRPQDIAGDQGTCSACGEISCTICKSGAHDGSECPRDETTQQLLQHATTQGWQRCYRCRAVVSLDRGCNHIS